MNLSGPYNFCMVQQFILNLPKVFLFTITYTIKGMELLFSISHLFFSLLYIYLQFMVILVEMRYLINWFLNVNPYFEPFVTLWAWTNPIFTFGRRWYPRIFGLDITPVINYKALNALLQVSDAIVSSKTSPFAGVQNEIDYDPSVSINKLEFSEHHFGFVNISHYLNFTDSLFAEFHNLI
jgi:uncharacterized protein YggT (Ycf19 family)